MSQHQVRGVTIRVALKAKGRAHLPESLDVVSTVGSSGEIRQVELDLVPALIKSHGHGADEGLDSRGRLVVRRSESTAHVLVIKHLHLESEVLLQLFHKPEPVSFMCR